MTGFEKWIGRQRAATDVVTDRLIEEFRVTLDAVAANEPRLPGIQWCLAPDALPPGDLGRDGHPRMGLLLPDLGLPRRMWAGGSLAYSGGIEAGETVERVSTIRDIRFKTGRTGRLGFLTIEHLYKVAGDTRIAEEQNIVYRDDPDPDATPPTPPTAEPWPPALAVSIATTPTLLFRYSAITFNGHRIHYDHPYATTVEGYGGLVVHGPMQATWMQFLATKALGRLPSSFAYRGLSPLICGREAAVELRDGDDGLEIRVRDVAANVVSMEASAR